MEVLKCWGFTKNIQDNHKHSSQFQLQTHSNLIAEGVNLNKFTQGGHRGRPSHKPGGPQLHGAPFQGARGPAYTTRGSTEQLGAQFPGAKGAILLMEHNQGSNCNRGEM